MQLLLNDNVNLVNIYYVNIAIVLHTVYIINTNVLNLPEDVSAIHKQCHKKSTCQYPCVQTSL